jgi:uncharacterized protein (DUF1800 family)
MRPILTASHWFAAIAKDKSMAITPAPGDRAAMHAAIAAHRFGLGEASLAVVGADPLAWLTSQIGPADLQRGSGLPTLAEGIRSHAQFRQNQRRRAAQDGAPSNSAGNDMRSGEQQFVDHFREYVQADVRAHLATAAASTRPFNERLALFWANHFTVSMAKPSTRALVGAFEREAIRPHVGGGFETMLRAAVTHGAMLRYLDNDQSAGPESRVVQSRTRRALAADDRRPRITGLNENLAREVLELHTLGAASRAYVQADVTAFAAVLTGWRLSPRAGGDVVAQFDLAWHEPGAKTVLGKSYAEGPQALDAVLRDLTRHPATARFVATKLARHFVADDPPPALVERLAQAFQRSEGELPVVYRELLAAPEAWSPVPAKLKTPEEFVVSTARLLGLRELAFARVPDGAIGTLGQRIQAAPSPAGWPDRAEDWLGPDAVWKRIEWATRVADRMGRQVDARALARASLGPLLSENTAAQIDRAADGAQALALLLMAPEFQRR